MTTIPEPATLLSWLQDTHGLGRALVQDLDDAQLMGPRLAIVNPLLWEMGHVVWFLEKWNLRREGQASRLAHADDLYDSAAVAHDTRWDLDLPSRADTHAYIDAIHEQVMEKTATGSPTPEDVYFVLLGIFHADMHHEAFLYTRQTHGYPAPQLPDRLRQPTDVQANSTDPSGDVTFPATGFDLGAHRETFFVFDNEKWAHAVDVPSFAMSRTAVSQGWFRDFVEDDGYARDEFWSPEGLRWRLAARATAPLHWRRDDTGAWQRRWFDTWRPVQPHQAMVHVNWFEAEAWCNWAGRRLPTEAEWEFAASTSPRGSSKRMFPWGDAPPTPRHANLGMRAMDTIDVRALPEGDSAWGMRQMIGNVWEWTANDFAPYPGFVPDPYKEYSQPWFHTHKTLRGGAWPSRGRMLRNTWRSFYTPDRRDVWAGFRTCALDR